MIEARLLVRRFGDVTAVDGVSLDVPAGEVLAALGPSGCGKTTLLRLVAGFETPDAGTLRLDGVDVAGAAWVPPERRRVGLVFQDYALFPHLSVAGNVGFGLPRAGRAARVRELLRQMGLDGMEGRFPHELSGGQQQRVAVARALAPRPRLVLLDEPFNTIDPELRGPLRADVLATLRAEGVTVVLVTHEREEAFALADRIVLLREGRVVQEGTAEHLYYEPVSAWSAGFLGDVNAVPAATLAAAAALPAALPRAGDEVLLRPELVALDVAADGPARVLERTFRGHDVAYRVGLPDGTVLVARRPSHEDVPVGAAVRLRILAPPRGGAGRHPDARLAGTLPAS